MELKEYLNLTPDEADKLPLKNLLEFAYLQADHVDALRNTHITVNGEREADIELEDAIEETIANNERILNETLQSVYIELKEMYE